MPETPKKPRISLVSPETGGIPPPRALGEHGVRLWGRVQAEYGITDSGGVELLVQICGAVDRIAALGAAIERDGAVVYGRGGAPKTHPAVKDELAARAFVARGLQRLGITVENVQSVGRPTNFASWIPPGR
jgi:hypothetical protein